MKRFEGSALLAPFLVRSCIYEGVYQESKKFSARVQLNVSAEEGLRTQIISFLSRDDPAATRDIYFTGGLRSGIRYEVPIDHLADPLKATLI